ncbi:MAG TPA: alpha-ketoglutarate-dependent dioxygenase AlkB [Candidatus Binatia bacterium]
MRDVNGDASLFEVSPKLPPGFVYRPNFLSIDEEQDLLRDIQQIELTPFKYYQFTGRRRTASFGWEYEFGKNQISQASDPPEFLQLFRVRAEKLFNIDPGDLVQLSLLEYSIGAPIGWHRDIPQFGVVVGISLNAPCRMRFREYSRLRAKKLRREDVLSIELQPRSAYLMGGPSRELWQHSIPPVKELRYAIMMRTLREKR